MTKLEYMQYVREKLQGYDREFVEEILENYEEHFEAGLKNGRSEEEICEELGNIENLLGDIQDVMGDKDLKTHEIDQFTAIEQPQESYSGIEEIELSLLSMDVQILPSRDGQLHVYLAEGKEKAKYLEESISGNRYFAREKNRSQGSLLYNKTYGQYDAIFLKEDSNEVYLTFDEGYEFGLSGQILDTLKEKGVKAIFFITGDFAKAEPELVQRMIDEGHVVGNHSWKHPNYSGLSVEEAEQDLMKLHDYVKENFNYTMRYFRFPAGNFSERALAEVQQLGYKSLFWSFAYKDWLTDDQPDEAESLTKIVDSACPGMVYLLHAVSKTNANVLADVIDGVVAKGFTWGDPSKI